MSDEQNIETRPKRKYTPVKRCNYTYESIESCMEGLLGRLVEKKKMTLEEAVETIQKVQALLIILDKEKTLAKALINEARTARGGKKKK